VKTAKDILSFWFDRAGPKKWYQKSDSFDALIRTEFEETALQLAGDLSRGAPHDWEDDSDSHLALIIALDQFPRNMYRGTQAAFAWDPLALNVAKRLVAKNHDLKISQDRRAFAYMPYMHSENLIDQDELDVICIPGGPGARAQLKNKNVINWVSETAKTCDWVTSVCTGSMILAKAGLTRGKRISTFCAAFDEFKALGLDGELQPNVRYVRDGNLVTSAGVSAGIDMALWLTGQMFSPAFSRDVARGMQYDPAPPYLADVE